MFPALGTDTPLLRLPLVQGNTDSYLCCLDNPLSVQALSKQQSLWYNVHSTRRLQTLRFHGCVLEFGKERAKLPQFHGIMCSDEHKEKP